MVKIDKGKLVDERLDTMRTTSLALSSLICLSVFGLVAECESSANEVNTRLEDSQTLEESRDIHVVHDEEHAPKHADDQASHDVDEVGQADGDHDPEDGAEADQRSANRDAKFETALVEGTITLDGEPLPNAAVVFLPEAGRPAGAVTDEKGHYVLSFGGGRMGAMLGRNWVRISTLSDPYKDEDGSIIPGNPETIPMKYNAQTQLEFIVTNGKNIANYAIITDGELIAIRQGENEGHVEITSIEGTVTMDGRPLPKASVVFIPESGRPAGAMTDENGRYLMTFSARRKRAILGTNKVRISTLSDPFEDGDGNIIPGTPETVPMNYNAATKVEFTVQQGENLVDFALNSKGELPVVRRRERDKSDEKTFVEGTITMDGKPLANAAVVLIPESGRPVGAMTDDNGHYVMKFPPGRESAMLGKNQVRISTLADPSENADGSIIPGSPETVPMKYNAQSELEFIVTTGKNIADFQMTSEGEIPVVRNGERGRQVEIAPVEGTVTMDGKPLVGAAVVFVPKAGRPAGAITDEKGQYILSFGRGRLGAMLGKNKVRISTLRDPSEDQDGNIIPGAPETVPMKYNVESQLEVVVEQRKNILDFALDSEGEIFKFESEEKLQVLRETNRAEQVEIAPVEGTVTMDGKPLANASIVFIPELGRPAGAMTDKKGHYVLSFAGGRLGAMLGRNKVRISTVRDPSEDQDGNIIPGAPEIVPMKYNARTELKYTVGKGKNVVNFDLSSDGEIFDSEK